MWNRKIILLILSVIVSLYSFSQGCSMCQLSVEANLKTENPIGAGLNDGILYLMAMPYLSILLFGVIYTLQKRKRNQTA